MPNHNFQQVDSQKCPSPNKEESGTGSPASQYPVYYQIFSKTHCLMHNEIVFPSKGIQFQYGLTLNSLSDHQNTVMVEQPRQVLVYFYLVWL